MQTSENLGELTNSDLVVIYNTLAPAPIKAWKGKKTKLIERIETMRKRASAAPKADAVPKPAVKRPAGEKSPTTARTIRAAAIELLCHTQFYEDRTRKSAPDNSVLQGHTSARSVGVPYDEIIRRIQAEFPGCNTTVACLRWYSVKIRVEELGYEGLRLPQRRPRAKARV